MRWIVGRRHRRHRGGCDGSYGFGGGCVGCGGCGGSLEGALMSRPSAEVYHYQFKYRGGWYALIKGRVHGRRIEVTVSPTGRSVQVHVDGERWVKA